MAASTSTIYANAKKFTFGAASDGDVDWVADTIKAVLVSSTYVPDYDAHAFFSSVTGTVLTAVTLNTKTLTKVGTGATAKYALKGTVDATGKVTFTGSVTARGMVLYKDTGTPATSPLLCYVLLDSAPADVTSTVGIELTPDATNGWLLVG